MTRIKKYVVAATVTAAVLAVPAGAYALTPGNASPAPSAAAPSTGAAPSIGAAKSRTASSVRVVAPGERVKAAPDVLLWLTEDGKHWSTPEGEQFRSVTDGNLDLSSPGVSRQSEPVGDRYLHSGVYYGTRDAARVEITTRTGRTVRASMVELAGKPGWGAWYTTTELPSAPAVFGPEGAGIGDAGESTDRPVDFIRSVTLYDTAGRVLATLSSPVG
ncbi:hypothetical protein KQY30_03780 [Streptomyces sp. GMY02]|uniref:hypothetical protein n=1 Tax=Streptomyces sp. GMY02 TaxID=1333528 RepID=UPI001C2BA814|nr:hypothetical protein [Streptomyces sp. GMY02]QXE33539.1 hypothetical protein KQY30_03780 [Streptomyces sp. GMY02]